MQAEAMFGSPLRSGTVSGEAMRSPTSGAANSVSNGVMPRSRSSSTSFASSSTTFPEPFLPAQTAQSVTHQWNAAVAALNELLSEVQREGRREGQKRSPEMETAGATTSGVGTIGTKTSHEKNTSPEASPEASRAEGSANTNADTPNQYNPETLTETLTDKPLEMLGAVISGPTPVVNNLACIERLSHWTMMPAALINQMPCLPGNPATVKPHLCDRYGTLSLSNDDPLVAEQFCLVLTAKFSLLMVLDRSTPQEWFEYSFDPVVIEQAWYSLRGRMVLRESAKLPLVDRAVAPFAPRAPHYQTVQRFGQALLRHLHLPSPATPEAKPNPVAQGWPLQPSAWRDPAHDPMQVGRSSAKNVQTSQSSQTSQPALDLELLQALAHEVRTPLATIQTLTKILLRRATLTDDLRPWVEQIDRECGEQIDRFGLIFRAVEFETSPVQRSEMQLTQTPLEAVVNNCIPRWQKQASRRSLQLQVNLPSQMPQVVSDPSLLDRVLTNAVEHFTSQLPIGSAVYVEMMPAGHQLKLQLKSTLPQGVDLRKHNALASSVSRLKEIGQLLTFQPETGSISLNLSVTKNLFRALGGKLTVRNCAQNGEVVTIFLPLG